MATESSLEENLKGAIQQELNNVYTVIPGIVIAVRNNLNTQEVDVQPTINQKMSDGTVKERTQILGVPVQFPSSKTSSLTFPINVGDPVSLHFSMRSLEAWKGSNGRPTTPVNKGKFDKSDCFAVPGLFPSGEAINNPSKHTWPHNTKDTVLVHNLGTGNEVEIRMQPNGDILVRTRQDVIVECENASVTANSNVDVTCADATVIASGNLALDSSSGSWTSNSLDIFSSTINIFGDISHSGAYVQSGIFTLNGTVVNTHTHQNQVPPMGV